MGINTDLQTLNPDAFIELYTLDLNPIGVQQKHRFCNHSQSDGSSLSFQQLTYNPLPIETEGFELTNQGQPPRPKISISNVEGTLSFMIYDFNDMVGAIVKRVRTMAKYLDGSSQTDPSQHLAPDFFYIERKTSENKLYVSFELSTPIQTRIKIPHRLLTQRCSWKYRGGYCGYSGDDYFDEFDNPVNNRENDKCGKRLNSCRIRFGENAPLPFGGFPGLDSFR